ncbi:MAG TPA: hypothetical protein DD733_10795, partial [Clostridiales bacterium]|nr:hypothetical protein [Clostridiales bacterium]
VKWANKYNKQQQRIQGKHSFVSEIVYGFHVIFHPFDGFWDIKHEKRGSVRGATFWLCITIMVFVYEGVGQGYLFNPGYNRVSILYHAFSVLLPLLLWATANWCLTTLFEGEGSFKDVYIASCYSLIPLPLIVLPQVILTNFVTMDEAPLLLALVSIAYFWLGLLIFFAMMVIHDYTLGKNILTVIGSVVGVAIIMFVTVLFAGLLTEIYKFVYNIFIELKYRYWS